jgi:hypothetical protein
MTKLIKNNKTAMMKLALWSVDTYCSDETKDQKTCKQDADQTLKQYM